MFTRPGTPREWPVGPVQPLPPTRQTRPGQDGKIQTKVISEDEGPRAGVTAESLGKLKPVPGTKLERLPGKKSDLGEEKYGEEILLPGEME